MSHIVKASKKKLFANFHKHWSKQTILNATKPNKQVTHALTSLRMNVGDSYRLIKGEEFYHHHPLIKKIAQ